MRLPAIPGSRAALVVAHPGHELRVHGWLEVARPTVFVLTDGSGRSGQSRLGSTTQVLARVGAEPGSIYGRLTDLEVYGAILNHNFDLFIGLAEELAEALNREEVGYIAGDAFEGHNSVHDIWRLVIGVAMELASRRRGNRIANFDFTLFGRPDDCPEAIRDRSIWIHLDDDGFTRKLEAVRGYNPKLAAEVDAALGGQLFEGRNQFSEPAFPAAVGTEFSGLGTEVLRLYPDLAAKIIAAIAGIEMKAFRVECLRPVHNLEGADIFWDMPPFYELYGEKLVEAGHYDRVIRYREHVVPLATALWCYVESSG
jgi:hypothetical protein